MSPNRPASARGDLANRGRRRLLIIEDEKSVAKQLKWSLGKEYAITIAGDLPEAVQHLETGNFPVALLDLGLPPHPDDPREDFSLLESLPKISPETRVIVLTGNSEEENAIKAISLGAADFCEKPPDLKVLKVVLQRTFRLQELEASKARLELQMESSGSLCGMIGISPAMQQVFALIRQAAATDYPVLVTGATGTGKEMAAQAVHQLSSRASGPFVIINCGAIAENLVESELFGHEKGAFTGAVNRHVGKFEQADGGTVFLDEIGELPLSMQVKLLRVLQESTIDRVGGRRPISLDVRVIAATNRDLYDRIRDGHFREDLFFRLNVFNIHLPDLSERGEDICLLAQHFLKQEARALGRGRLSFAPDALTAMSEYPWPGNVRELQNRIRRAVGLCNGDRIDAAALGLGASPQEGNGRDTRPPTLREARLAAERDAVTRALALTGHNISRAAKLLEVSRPTLHDLIKKLGIDLKKEK